MMLIFFCCEGEEEIFFFFFFQAEDGIRDYKVTGVQTCALPISQAASQIGLCGAQYSMSGSIAPKRSAKANCKRCTGWIEPPAALAKLISGRFERAASSAVIMIGTAAMTEALTVAAANGFMLARRGASGGPPAIQCASTNP